MKFFLKRLVRFGELVFVMTKKAYPDDRTYSV